MKPLAFFAACTVLAAQAAQPQQPVFRSGATIVPLDVRVLDRSGKPITDLRQDEFIVTENGRPQVISHFSATGLTAMPAADNPGLLRATLAAESLTPQTRRVFLLLLGRGHLQIPSKGVDAMRQFVSERVLPQDQVAVLAWHRATDFTTNHDGLAELLDRFKARHEKIETELAEWFRGLRAIYGDRTIPPHIQKQIDDVFAAPGLRAAHTVVTDPNQQTPTKTELLQRTEALRRGELVADRPAGTSMRDGLDPMTAITEGSFEQFMASMLTTNQDVSNLYAGIEYLRFIEGEKHIVFVTELGISLPDFSMEQAIASVANNARVVVDTIQTGGAPSSGLPSAANRFGGIPPMSFGPMFAMQSLRMLSEETGGVSSIYSYADKGTKRIDETTRFSYLLAYSPANTQQDSRYHRVSVKVTRPGAQVLYRHGYFARPQTLPPNRRDMMSYTRMSTALTTAVNVYDIPLGFKTSDEKDGSERVLAVDLSIGLAKLTPIMIGASRQYNLDLAVVCSDRDQKTVGQHSQPVSFTLTEAQFQQAAKDGAGFSVRIPVTSYPTFVKVVV